MTKKSQFGRSMIEMLGVLAIIGVLSIGGLAGYTKAMRAHKVNNIIDYVNRAAVEWRAQVAAGHITMSEYSESDDVFPCEELLDEDLPAGLDGCQFNYINCNGVFYSGRARKLIFHPITADLWLEVMARLKPTLVETWKARFAQNPERADSESIQITYNPTGEVSVSRVVCPPASYE